MNLKQHDAAARLNVTQSRISELANKINKFTLDAMLDKLGFRISLTLLSNDAGSPSQIVITEAPSS